MYESVQEDIKSILEKADSLQQSLVSLVEEDAGVFEPLSGAYGLPCQGDRYIDMCPAIINAGQPMAAPIPTPFFIP